MKPWDQRPFEIRNLFNPAFCGLLLARAINEHEETCGKGMPYSLSLLILPLCLHKNTRLILAAANKSYFLKVVEERPQLLVDFPARATNMFPFCQEGLSLLASKGCLDVSEFGTLMIRPRSVRKAVSGTEENRECQRVAKYLGRQFARISDRATIYASLGVRP
ncbi:hypothetical protein J7400_20910 [Shimia sp. R9_2]|uniref:three component ABC system middle component n=1 Tax=Shimia sp. R9_2 TaxID=2821112 RepID=UPI001ADBF9C9|nr:three component ABC system middle component [Shimia sp. R9_2]MBO9399144.1 hypothetical protein [Shimia sp. R9_2]